MTSRRTSNSSNNSSRDRMRGRAAGRSHPARASKRSWTSPWPRSSPTFFRRLAFFARLHDLQFLLTQSITQDSKVIINRTLPERLEAICPFFLICDPDPYITIIDGQLKWINDAYTYSRAYPYSTPHRAVAVNYLRNSVKVV